MGKCFVKAHVGVMSTAPPAKCWLWARLGQAPGRPTLFGTFSTHFTDEPSELSDRKVRAGNRPQQAAWGACLLHSHAIRYPTLALA